MSDSSAATANIGVTGLAVMGRNLARNLARHGHTVALHNRTYARTESLVDEHGDEGTFVPSESLADFVASLSSRAPSSSWSRPAQPTDAVIDELVPLLDDGRHHHRLRQRALRRHPPPRDRRCATRACTSSAAASPAARRARSTGRRSCPAARPSRTRSSARSSSRSPRRSTATRRAACTSARTAPATS